MKNITEFKEQVYTNVEDLGVLGVTNIAYNLKAKKWRITYRIHREQTRGYYKSYADKRVEADTFEETVDKLRDVLSQEAASRVKDAQRQAQEAKKRAENAQKLADDLAATASRLKEAVQ